MARWGAGVEFGAFGMGLIGRMGPIRGDDAEDGMDTLAKVSFCGLPGLRIPLFDGHSRLGMGKRR